MANVFAFLSPRAPARSAANPDGLADMLDEITHNVNRESDVEGVRLGVLLSAVGRRSYGPLLLIMGLFAISPATVVPGMTSLTALVTLLIALQMALGFRRPWLPKSILDIKAPRRVLFEFLDRARPSIDRFSGIWLRPRLTFLTAPPFVNLVALCIGAAALITLPLSLVPFAPIAPGLAIVFFGLGMTARDGLWLALGAAAVGGAFWLAAPLVLH